MSSELKKIKNPEFRQRLMELIGDEREFTWARRVGISKGAFDRIINEGTIPSHKLLLRIYKNTGVSLTWLLTGEGPMYKADHRGASVGDYKQEIVREPDTAAAYSTISIQDLIRDLMDIMDSDDAGTKLAITQNIKMFKESVRRKQKLDAETDFKIQKGSGGY